MLSLMNEVDPYVASAVGFDEIQNQFFQHHYQRLLSLISKLILYYLLGYISSN